MDTIFKTLRVKATTIFVRLRIYLCALKIPTLLRVRIVLVMRVTAWVRVSTLVSSIAMVVLGRLASLSNGVGADLLGASLGGMNLTWLREARIPSREIRGVAVVYFTHVTSPNLLIFTPTILSLGLGGSILVSFGTTIFGPLGASYKSKRSCGVKSVG
jgi:hypothetical protein